MCGKINNTLCSRENINVHKIWAPKIENVLEEIDALDENIDVIVIHSMTNDLQDKNVDDLVDLTSTAVDKGLCKAKKVVISSIINRDDDLLISTKAAAVNAIIRFKFVNNPRVVLCINDNLKEKKFRCDKVHLTERGVSRFANNLKYKIAGALDITVTKKLAGDRHNYASRFSNPNWY